MKKLATIFAFILTGNLFASAGSHASLLAHRNFDYGDSFIFVENGITFSVFPDGEFDFYIDNPNYVGVDFQSRNLNISFNSGFNYDPYVQYDDYGAIIQIENTPIFYDFYGRVTRIGSVDIFYNNGRLSRLGGLYVHYNNLGVYTHYTGFINVYNRVYVYRPFHRFFVRPAVNFCLVSYRPYRMYYTPVRYTYYRPYVNNHRRVYATVGRTYHYRENPSRVRVYNNDRRVAVRDDRNISREIRNRSLESNTRRSYSERNDNGNARIERNQSVTRSSTNTNRIEGRNSFSNDRKQRDYAIKQNGRTENNNFGNNKTRTESSVNNNRRYQPDKISRSSEYQVRQPRENNRIERSNNSSENNTRNYQRPSQNRKVERAPQKQIERKATSTVNRRTPSDKGRPERGRG